MAEVPDNGPLMTRIIWFITSFCFPFLAGRVFVRIIYGKGLWWDDWTLMVSWMCLLGQTLGTQVAIGNGFGKHLHDVEPTEIYYIALFGQIGLTFAAGAIVLSKVSFAVTLLRLTHNWWKVLVWFSIATMACLGIPAAILPWVRCRPFGKSLDDTIPGECFDKEHALVYAFFMTAWNALMDFVLASISWTIVWKLQMTIPEKLGFGVCMSLGILAGVVAIVKSFYIRQFDSHDFSYNGVDITAWSAAESAAAIIAASIPVLRVFTRQRDPRKSHRTKSFAEIHMSRLENTHCTDPRNTVAEVWITANNRDDDSDRSILREDHQPPPAWGILQTQTVKVANQSAGSGGRNYSTSE